jgi:cardiolipin synthase
MSAPTESTAESRILTVPNLITLLRLACLPLFVWLLLGRENPLAAGALLGVLGATDWVDGWYARRFNAISNLGKIFDPVVDRLLFFVSIVAIIIAGSAPLWFCVAVLAREVAISMATLVLASLGARRIDVTWVGKAATFGLMFAFPGFLWASTDWLLQPFFEIAAWACAIPALAASYYAAALYVPLGLQALREGRKSRASRV